MAATTDVGFGAIVTAVPCATEVLEHITMIQYYFPRALGNRSLSKCHSWFDGNMILLALPQLQRVVALICLLRFRVSGGCYIPSGNNQWGDGVHISIVLLAHPPRSLMKMPPFFHCMPYVWNQFAIYLG